MKQIEALQIQFLKQLGLKGAIHDFIPLTSRQVGDMLGISQQSASRYLLTLLKTDLIERQLRARSQLIKISEKGLEVLNKEYADYRQLFKLVSQLRIRGVAVSGLGEGKYYIGQQGYSGQFQQKLWFKPYEGTLNVKLLINENHKLKILQGNEGILVHGFEDEETKRTFGDVKCFLAKIQTIDCAIVMPMRSHYNDVIEVISQEHLRTNLGINDGDIIEIEIYL